MGNTTFKYNILKTYLSVKGWFRTKFFFEELETYRGGSKNYVSIYRGNRTFYEQENQSVPTFGVQYYSTRNKQYPYWQLGMFEWKKITAKIEK